MLKQRWPELDSEKLPKAGGTMTGALTLPAGVLNNASGTERPIYFLTSGSNRWEIRADPSVESGGNAGSDFQLLRYNDSGTFIGVPIQISRATGLTTLESLTVSGPATASGGLTTSAVALTADFNSIKWDTHWRATRDTAAASDGNLVFQHSTDNFSTAFNVMVLEADGSVALNVVTANLLTLGKWCDCLPGFQCRNDALKPRPRRAGNVERSCVRNHAHRFSCRQRLDQQWLSGWSYRCYSV